MCGKDQKVSNKACVPCEKGKTNAAGDSATGEDTECDGQPVSYVLSAKSCPSTAAAGTACGEKRGGSAVPRMLPPGRGVWRDSGATTLSHVPSLLSMLMFRTAQP